MDSHFVPTLYHLASAYGNGERFPTIIARIKLGSVFEGAIIVHWDSIANFWLCPRLPFPEHVDGISTDKLFGEEGESWSNNSPDKQDFFHYLNNKNMTCGEWLGEKYSWIIKKLRIIWWLKWMKYDKLKNKNKSFWFYLSYQLKFIKIRKWIVISSFTLTPSKSYLSKWRSNFSAKWLFITLLSPSHLKFPLSIKIYLNFIKTSPSLRILMKPALSSLSAW